MLSMNNGQACLDDLRRRLYLLLKTPQLAGFATVTPDGKPWVRYVMVETAPDLEMRFSSFADSRKLTHIARNPEVHLTCGVGDTLAVREYLQIEGRARFSQDKVERERLWSDLLEGMFEGPDDPRYGVVIVTPYRIELHTVGCPDPEVWTAG